jgi:hypothetical protein
MTTKELAITLLDKQYSLVGLSFDEVCKMERDEFTAYKMTLEQQKEWSAWAVEFAVKKKRWSKKLAQREVAMLDFQHGLSLIL